MKKKTQEWNVLFEQHVKAKFCKPPDYYVASVVLRFKVIKFILHAVASGDKWKATTEKW